MSAVVQKNNIRKILYSRGMIIILIIIAFFLIRAVLGVYEKAQSTGENLALAESDLEELRERELLLKEVLENLDSEKGVEAEIREKFNVVKEGEKVIMIVDPLEGEIVEEEELNISLWERLLLFFK